MAFRIIITRCCLLFYIFFFSLIESQQINRIIEKSASCDDNFLYFAITFENSFVGLIYTDGEYGNLRCTYVNGSTFASTRYNITIPLTDCRSQKFQNGTRQNAIIVQKDSRILESTDNMFVLSCSPTSSNFAGGYGPNQRFTLTFLGITVQNGLTATEVVTNSNSNNAFTTLDYAVEVQLGQGPNGRPIDRVLSVGEPISYVVRLKNLHSTDVRIGRCWATDGVSDIQLSDDDGCSLQPSNNIWNSFKSSQSDNGGRILYNNIKTWAFPTSNRVNIFCNLHVCSPVCSATNCPLGSKSSRRSSIITRSRRDFNSDNSTTTIEIQSGYRVLPFRSGLNSRADDIEAVSSKALNSSNFNLISTTDDDLASTNNSERKICLSRTVFIAAVVLLLIIIFLTFAFVIFMLVYMYRSARRRRLARRHFTQCHSNVALCSDGLHK